MEVRCAKCNKLFRVLDDKITGSGVKFACTRCGDYVKITREEFEHYTLSKNAVSPLDMFEAKPVVEPTSAAVPASGPQPAQASKPGSMTEIHPGPEQKSTPEPRQAPALQPAIEQARVSKPLSEPVHAAAAAVSSSEQTVPSPSTAPKKEHVRPAAPIERKAVISAPPVAPARSGKLILVLIAALIILGLLVYGVYAYRTSFSKGKDAAQEASSIEGLRITDVLGSFDASGDLLVTGVVENSLEQEKTAWYVTVEVYNAQGDVLSKIRVLNGKQLFTQRDYEILAKRGVNIEDLKTRTVQEQGVVIPPKGSVPFEIRYVQPPAGIASFNATLQPFDPVRLFKEIAEDLK